MSKKNYLGIESSYDNELVPCDEGVVEMAKEMVRERQGDVITPVYFANNIPKEDQDEVPE